MIDVLCVTYDSTKQIVFLSPGDSTYEVDDKVIVGTENGFHLATVKKGNYKQKKENFVLPLDKVVRKATDEDLKQYDENLKNAEKALTEAKKISKDLNLDMNFLDAFYNLDKSQLLFSFLADDRIDFRELAKKLAQKYKTRIELRQIGVRDKAKRVGGLGPCGLFLCCNSFLTDFNSVSINMAKNQFLALNPSKINGVCGRLLCCLGYENDVYTELKKDFPKLGSIIETEYGIGKIVEIDVFKHTYSVDLKEKGIVEFELEGSYGKNK